MDPHLSLQTTVLLTPRLAGLRNAQDNAVEVLLRVQAPDAPAGHLAARAPQAVALVLDRSGSMSGEPLAQAQRCAAFVASRLRPTDLVSVVQFDDRVHCLLPAVPLGDGSAVRQAVAGIRCGGTTNLHGGWLRGAQALAELAGVAQRRVVLLSDGRANVGIRDPQEIAQQCAAQAALGISTSTCGLGACFNEDLMVAMARAGGGNSYYGDTAEDLMDPFEQELDLLANLYLAELNESVTPADGVVVEALSELPSTPDGGWRLPDLAWGAEAWAVWRLTVPHTSLPPPGGLCRLLRVQVQARDPHGQPVRLERAGLALPVLHAQVHDSLPPDELVARRLVELAAAQALARMHAAAKADDWDEVNRLLAEVQRRYASHPWLSGMLGAMTQVADRDERARLGKEALYASLRLRNRLASKQEPDDPAALASLPSYVYRKVLQGTRNDGR